MRTFALLAIFCGLALAESNRTSCALSPDVEGEYLALPPMSDYSLSWQDRYSPRRALAGEHPNDWPLQLLLQEPIRNRSNMGREWDLAIAKYRALPDRTLGELLEARLFSGVYRKKSRQALDKVLAQASDSPWPHLALLEWADASKDIELAEREFAAFRQQCPGSILPFHYLTALRDPEKLRRAFDGLRKTLDSLKNDAMQAQDIPLFQTLWTWEKVTYGAARPDEFERIVRSDLAALRAHPLYYSDEGWSWTVSFGYEKALNDSDAAEAFLSELLERAPTSQTVYSMAMEKLEKGNPAPKQDSTPTSSEIPASFVKATEEYGARQVALMTPLIERFRGRPYAAFDAVQLLISPSLSVELTERFADFVLSNAERCPDWGGSSLPAQIEIAEAYLQRNILLDRVPALVQAGLEEAAYQSKYTEASEDYDLTPRPAPGESNIAIARDRAREILLRHAILTHQPGRARTLLDEIRTELQQSMPADSSSREAHAWSSKHDVYLTFAHQAGIDVSPLAERSFKAPPPPERSPVADFEAKDLSGRTWRLADLKGKVTFVTVWGSYEFCQGEMPGVQKLYEHWKDRSDRVVLTIAVGEHRPLVESIIKENQYTFPVIYGMEIAEKFFPGGRRCQSGVLDGQGRRLARRELGGPDKTIAAIDDLADKIAMQ